jgi:hypothetical protein
MIDPLTTFGAASGGGILTGLIKYWISTRNKREERKERSRENIDALLAGKRAHQLSAAQQKPVRYESYKEKVRLRWFFFGKPYTTSTTKKIDKLSQLPRERFLDLTIFILVLAYISFIFWFLYQNKMIVETIDPKAGNRFSILGLLEFEWGKNKSMKFTGGGAGLYLISPIGMWISHHLVGKDRG